jgi:hypothetical protein
LQEANGAQYQGCQPVKPRHRKLDQLSHTETEARKLARSGNYRGFGSIQIVLLTQGFAETSKVFANRWTCSELDRLCEQARHAVRLFSDTSY